MTKIILTVVGLVAVAILVTFLIMSSQGTDPLAQGTNSNATTTQKEPTSTSSETTNPDNIVIGNSVILAQTEEGNFATVANTNLTKSGFVVLFKTDSNGKSTPIGNSELLSAGSHTNVKIQLDSVIAYKQAIVGVLYEDDGDGEYDEATDVYLKTSAGTLASDVDVVGITGDDAENRALQTKVEAYLDNDELHATGTATSS